MASNVKSVDALNLLKQDHREIEKLFQGFERCTGATERHDLCQQICTELIIHSELEEQCLYPEVRSMAGLEEMVDESLREHSQVKEQCTQIKAMQPGDASLAERVRELKQAVEQHVKEEERELFPQVRELCDQQWLLSLGRGMEEQKTRIAAQMTEEPQRIREDVQEPSRTNAWS